MTAHIQPSDDQILGYLRGCNRGTTISASALVLGFGGTTQQHTVQLARMVAAGQLVKTGTNYALS